MEKSFHRHSLIHNGKHKRVHMCEFVYVYISCMEEGQLPGQKCGSLGKEEGNGG